LPDVSCDHRGGRPPGSHAEPCAGALARYRRQDGRGNRPSIVPSGHDQTVYLVINNFGKLGTAFLETDIEKTDLETVIGDLMSDQYDDPVRIVAFNTAEGWSADASEDIAREILRRANLTGHELPLSIQESVDSHLGVDRQLTLRLA
jgi:hypothetical protein